MALKLSLTALIPINLLMLIFRLLFENLISFFFKHIDVLYWIIFPMKWERCYRLLEIIYLSNLYK